MVKRWFIPLVCLVLVCSLLAPTVALAASGPSIQLSNYETSVTDYGSYKLHNYSYSQGHFSKIMYTNSGVQNLYSDSRTFSFDFSQRASGVVTIYAGFAANNLSYSSGKDGFLVSDIISDEYFKLLTVDVPIKITSSVATTCTAYLSLYCLSDAGNGFSYHDSTTQTISLSPGVSVNKTFSVSLASFGNGEVAIFPRVCLKFSSPPSSGTVTVDAYSFNAQAKIGTGIPDYPIFNRNIGGTITYLKNAESDAFTVSASVGDGGIVSYKWYENTTNSNTGGKHIKSGNTFYPPTGLAGTLYYYCVATNSINGQESSTTSGVVTVHVIGPPEAPQITQNLGAGTVEYEQGDVALPLTITAITIDGGDLTYQWYENTADSTEGGSMIDGATYDRYYPSTSVIGIKYYYCVITNTISGYTASTTSSVGAVRVVSPPDPAVQPVITSDLSTEEVIYMTGSAAAALRIGAEAPDGGELTYQWYSMTDSPSSGVSGVAIPGANTASYTPETVVAGTTYYYCVVTNKLNDTSADVRSKVAMITVEEPPPETVPPQLDEMNDKLDETNNLLDWISVGIGGMWDAILNLPQAILDGIKGLFVPDAEAIAAYQDQWSELLKERFGAIYESVDVIGDFVLSLNAGSKQEQITFPAVTVNLAGVPWSFGGWTVSVVPEGFSFLATSSKLIVNIIATFAFINGLRNKFEGILGGRGS